MSNNNCLDYRAREASMSVALPLTKEVEGDYHSCRETPSAQRVGKGLSSQGQ